MDNQNLKYTLTCRQTRIQNLKFPILTISLACRHTFALQKIGAVAASHRDTAQALGETSGRVKELQVIRSSSLTQFDRRGSKLDQG